MRRRLRQIDPKLRLGITMANFWSDAPVLIEQFNERVISRLDFAPDFIILHFYPDLEPDNFTERGMEIRPKIFGFRKRLMEHGLDPELPIFVTEWNAASKSQHVRGQSIGHVLSVAQGLLELSDSRVQAAAFWPLQPGQKSLLHPTDYKLQPAGEMFSLMREVMAGAERIPVRVQDRPQYLEATGFLDRDANRMRVVLINRHAQQELKLELNLPGAVPASTASVHKTSPSNAPSADMNTTDFRDDRHSLTLTETTATLTLPPLSVSILECNSTKPSEAGP
jgi:hypothetical protein